MRINRYIASSTGLSRRAADKAIEEGQITVNGTRAVPGQLVTTHDQVRLDGTLLHSVAIQTVLMNKPAGYVTSRTGQGSKTIYDILPENLQHLKPVGRLDKDSSGLLLLTNDGDLAQQLTHPGFQKIKIYEVTLNKPLEPLHHQMISDHGIQLQDGPSKFALERLKESHNTAWRVTMHEGRNRQIRRTFSALGYTVAALHRTQFGQYSIDDLPSGAYRVAQGLRR